MQASILPLAVCLLSASLLTWVVPDGVSGAQPPPPRLKRADSFLGIHFDFHAGRDCQETGKSTTRAMSESPTNHRGPSP